MLLSTDSLLMRNPWEMKSLLAWEKVFTTNCTFLPLMTSRTVSVPSPIFLTISALSPFSRRKSRVPFVATRPYPISLNRLASISASSLSLSPMVKSTFPYSPISYPAAIMALYSALLSDLSRPMTSPVDFISGPRAMSTLRSLLKEKTGIFTA